MRRSRRLFRLRRRRRPLGRRRWLNSGARPRRFGDVRRCSPPIPRPISSRCPRPARSRIASVSEGSCVSAIAFGAALCALLNAGSAPLVGGVLIALGASRRRRRRHDERRGRPDRTEPRPADSRASSCGRLGRDGDRGDPRQPDRCEPDALGGRAHRRAGACRGASPTTARRGRRPGARSRCRPSGGASPSRRP